MLSFDYSAKLSTAYFYMCLCCSITNYGVVYGVTANWQNDSCIRAIVYKQLSDFLQQSVLCGALCEMALTLM